MKYGFLYDSRLDESQISTRDESRKRHGSDWGTNEDDASLPDVVVWPESTADVATVLSAANSHGVPVTPYAAGTSLEGHPVPVRGGISLNMTKMNSVLDVRPDDFQIDVQPGVLGSSINDAVERYGLFFPPLPSSGDISTIGGMIANDASGMQTVKYGEVHDWILRLEAVLPDGTIIETGTNAAKTSAGYNLLDLLVGSEGTLAVVTEATLELTGRPEQVWGGRVTFDTVGGASTFTSDVIRWGVDVAKIELLDKLSVEIVNEHLDAGLEERPMVFVEFHTNHSAEDEVAFFESVVDQHPVVDCAVGESGAEMETLWMVREEMATALKNYNPELTILTSGDVTVPISTYADLIRYISSLEDEYGLEIPCFGHAGDGNVHYTIFVRSDDDRQRVTGERVDRNIVERAIDLGGTCTGEHGVGMGKKQHLASEYSHGTMELMRRIKRAFDPNGTLNPGKMF
ncbi:lactate dehydrogenase, partial [Haloferax sp. Atlit-12N]|uniref:FAD-binding oxidoreductase n=1 Tax=Haloferax sp. Atlit-12N TaxID=2077203 RepID=UPI000E3AFE40